MRVAVLLYDRIVAAEAIGPYEVLHRVPGVDLTFVGAERGLVWDRKRVLALHVDTLLEELPAPDVLVVPGGLGVYARLDDTRLVDWIRTAHRTTTWTASVGSGALLLARAGILRGVEATTHWATVDELSQLGAIPVEARVVESGKVLTAAGNTAGFDMALRLAERISDRLTAEAVQLWIEYDPQPPFDAGSLAKASEHVVQRSSDLFDAES